MVEKKGKLDYLNLFDWEEKRKVVQLLIIISAIFVAFNPISTNVSWFAVLIIFSLFYLIFDTAYGKSEKKEFNLWAILSLFGLLLSSVFSVIIFSVGDSFSGHTTFSYILVGLVFILLSFVLIGSKYDK